MNLNFKVVRTSRLVVMVMILTMGSHALAQVETIDAKARATRHRCLYAHR